MKHIIIGISIIILLLAAGCATEKPIGREKDEHGCLPTAGYTWCEPKQKCLREWEEACLPAEPEEETGLTPEECIEAGGRTLNIVGGDSCNEDETNIGQVIGFISPNICCIPGRVTLSMEEAFEIAQNSECTEKGDIIENYMYNENSQTWWIDIEMKPEFKQEFCNPACVVSEADKTAEINWRCTGALPPE